MAEAARELGIELEQPESVNDEAARERIAAAAPEAVCVCAFGALIKEPLLSEHPMLNVHPSLLPRWRGAAPIERAIMAGDERTGVCDHAAHRGPGQRAGLPDGRGADRPPTTPTARWPQRLAPLGGELLVRALDDRSAVSTSRTRPRVTYAEKITAEDRRLDPARPAAELERVVRALTPHIGAVLTRPRRRAAGRLGGVGPAG